MPERPAVERLAELRDDAYRDVPGFEIFEPVASLLLSTHVIAMYDAAGFDPVVGSCDGGPEEWLGDELARARDDARRCAERVRERKPRGSIVVRTDGGRVWSRKLRECERLDAVCVDRLRQAEDGVCECDGATRIELRTTCTSRTWFGLLGTRLDATTRARIGRCKTDRASRSAVRPARSTFWRAGATSTPARARRGRSTPPAQRTCKHLRAYLGDAHEDARVGLSPSRVGASADRTPPSRPAPPIEPIEVRARREAAVETALARFPAVAERMQRVYRMPLPKHLAFAAAFWMGLSTEEREQAWAHLGTGLAGVGAWFLDGGLDRSAELDERLHFRYRRDPPEFVTVATYNTDGGHWGLWYDVPRELPRVVAFNDARDDAVSHACEPTLLASIVRHLTDDPSEEGPSLNPSVRAWLDEMLARERDAHREEAIPLPRTRTRACLSGMDPVIDGERVPDDLTGRGADRRRYEAYRARDPIVHTWIQEAWRELGEGRPMRALFLGRELHYMDLDAFRESATTLLAAAYRALDRPELAEVAEVHHANRNLRSVDVYAHAEEPLVEAAAAGDVDALRARLAEGPSREELTRAVAAARKPEPLALLLERAPSLASTRLEQAIDALGAACRALATLGNAGGYADAAAQADRVIDVLLAHGASVDDAFARALDARIEPLARRLAERADPRAADAHGVTPLHRAVSAGMIDVVEILLARGADRSAKDAAGRTPRDRARDLWKRERDLAGRLLALFPEPASPASDPEKVPLRAGDRVRHAKFGEGTIESVDATGKLTIRFADSTRTLLARFVVRA